MASKPPVDSHSPKPPELTEKQKQVAALLKRSPKWATQDFFLSGPVWEVYRNIGLADTQFGNLVCKGVFTPVKASSLPPAARFWFDLFGHTWIWQNNEAETESTIYDDIPKHHGFREMMAKTA